MQAQVACHYMGVCERKFLDGVSQGRYPAPVNDGRNRLWHRVTLDDWLARERGEVLDTPTQRRAWGRKADEDGR